MDAILSTLGAHLSTQFDHTLQHLAVGALLAHLFATIGLGRRAWVPVASIAFVFEFLWQLPVRDAGALKLLDRTLDAGEWVVGALVVEWLVPLLALRYVMGRRLRLASPLLRA